MSVVDFGQAESGEPYLVMEYLEGEDLDHRLRRVGRMSIEAVAHVVGQVASALNAAHDQGVVHRDLKPGNVFLVQIPVRTKNLRVESTRFPDILKFYIKRRLGLLLS